jgi:VCBS repeat-containing protein
MNTEHKAPSLVPAAPAGRGVQRRRPAALALEPRLMFDAAVVTSAAEAATRPADAPWAVAAVSAAGRADSRSAAPDGARQLPAQFAPAPGSADRMAMAVAADTFAASATAPNEAPSFTVGSSPMVLEDAGAQTITGWATNISAGPASESGQTLTFAVTNNNNALFSVQPEVSANGTLTFTPAANAAGTATVTVTLSDDGGTDGSGVDTSAPQTFTISVTAVNDAPSFVKGGDQTVPEDSGAHTVTGWATGISAGPAGESAQTATFTVTNTNNALFSSQPAIDASGNLTYTPAANASGSATVTVTLKDNGGTANGGVDTSASQTFTITVNPVNDAPTGMGNTSLPTVWEDTLEPAGTAISALSGLNFVDVDAGSSLSGVAVVGNTANAATEGVWQYSTNGRNWHAVGGVSETSALLLSASTQLRFVPVADYHGTPASLTVRAIDDTYGGGFSVGAASQSRFTRDVLTNGGTTAFAANTNTISVTVAAVNDAPSFVMGANPTVSEDSGPQTVTGWATGMSAGPANEAGQTLSFTSSNSNNALFSTQPSVDSAGKLSFTPAANANGIATVTVRLTDTGGTANGGVNFVEKTFTISVTPVNDAPTGRPGLSGSAIEGQSVDTSTAGIADVDGLLGVTFHHQWQQSADGTTWTDIAGATGNTLVLGGEQAGHSVRVKTTFTDNGGTLETLYSLPSPTIAGVVPQVDAITRVGSALVGAATTSLVFNVTFNTAVDGVDTGDFVLTNTTGAATGSIATITGTGATRQVTVDSLSGNGDLRLDLKNSGTGIVSGSATPIAGGFSAGQAYTLDRVAPVISGVSGPNVPLRVGEVATVTITVDADGGDAYTLVSGSVGGFALTNLTRVNQTMYNALFTVTEGGNDYAASADLPVNLVLRDSAGNTNAAYTTAMSQPNDSINANTPTAVALSNSTVRSDAGANAVVGELSTTDATVSDSFTYMLVSGGGSTDNASFTVVGSNLRMLDPAAQGDGVYSVRLRVTDGGGNNFEQVLAITVTSYVAPVAVSDSATAIEAGGVANAAPGVNPTGNVLANDTSSSSKVVSEISGGTLGTPLSGTYGALTLQADGAYTYVVNNSLAAVQALRTNADTLSDVFSYTMRDAEGATSSTTLTITLRGANDAPTVNGTITQQAATVGTAFSFTVPAGMVTDPDAGDTLTWSARLQGGAALPAWLSFDAATRTFSGTPVSAETLSLTVTATDLATASGSITFTLEVGAASPPPAPPPPAVLPPALVDDRGDAVEAGGVSNATPGADASGNVLANDSGDGLTVVDVSGSTGTRAPGLAVAGTYGQLTLQADGSYVYQIDNSAAAVQALRLPTDTLSEQFSYTVRDANGAFATATLSITLHGANDAPVAVGAVPDASAQAGQAWSMRLPAGLFSDVDAGDALRLSAALADGGALPGWLQFDAATGTFSGTPTQGGTFALQVLASDRAGAQALHSFKLVVAGESPTMAQPDSADAFEAGGVFNATPGQDASGNVLANDALTGAGQVTGVAFGAAPGTVGTALAGRYGALTLQADGSYVYRIDQAHAEVQALRSADDTLQERFSYSVRDAAGVTSSGVLTVTLHGANDAPVARADEQSLSVTAGAALAHTLAPDSFADVDAGDVLQFAATLADGSALPDWLRFDSATGQFSGTPLQAGRVQILLTATDRAGAQAQTLVTLDVHAPVTVPAPPPVPTSGAPTGATGPGLEGTAPAPLWSSGSPASGGGLPVAAPPTFSGPVLPVVVPAGLPGTGVAPHERLQSLDLAPFTSFLPAYTTAQDDSFPVLLSPAATGLVVLHGLGDQRWQAGQDGHLQIPADVFAHGVAGAQVGLQLRLADGRPLPAWLRLDPQTGVLEGTPPPGTQGALELRLIARDQQGRSVDVVFRLEIEAGPARPQAAAEPQPGRAGFSAQLRAAAERSTAEAWAPRSGRA